MNQLIDLKIFKLKVIYLLLLILFFGSFLRIYDIWNNPKALYGDELTMVYDTYSIYKTGMDQLGNLHPLTFPMGEGRAGGYIYFSVPFVALFGPSALGVRGLSILSGILIILLMFYMGRKLVSTEVGLLAAFFTALSPWDISLSRGGFETHFALLLSLLGALLILWAEKKPWLYLVSAICFVVAINTYPTFKLTLPLFILLIVWFIGGIKKLFTKGVRGYTVGSLLILVAGGVIVLSQTFGASSDQRFAKENVFGQVNTQQHLIQTINKERTIQDDSPISALFHNRYLENILLLGDSYIRNLSVNFLFLHGDGDPVHNMATMGELFWFEAPLLLFGIWWLITKGEKRLLLFLLGWILIVPIATSFLLDIHALRDDFMLPPLLMLASIGAIYVLRNLQNLRWVFGILVALFIFQFIFFIERTYFLSADEFAGFWSYPAKQAALFAASQKANYDYVIVSSRLDNIEFAYETYNKLDPNLVIEQNRNRFNLNGYGFKKFGNVYIGSLPIGGIQRFVNSLNGRVLYVGAPTDANELRQSKGVSDSDGTVGWINESK